MASKNEKKLLEASKNLSDALRIHEAKTIPQRLSFLTFTKAFEVLLEYAWKELKRAVEDEGVLAPSPKEAIRQAAKLGMIEDLEDWLDCINARNDSVHDYFGIPEKDYLVFAKRLLELVDQMRLP